MVSGQTSNRPHGTAKGAAPLVHALPSEMKTARAAALAVPGTIPCRRAIRCPPAAQALKSGVNPRAVQELPVLGRLHGRDFAHLAGHRRDAVAAVGR